MTRGHVLQDKKKASFDEKLYKFKLQEVYFLSSFVWM